MTNYYVVTDYDGWKYVVFEDDLPDFNAAKKSDYDSILTERKIEGPMPLLKAINIVEDFKKNNLMNEVK